MGLVELGDDYLNAAQAGYDNAGRREADVQKVNRELKHEHERSMWGLAGGLAGQGASIANSVKPESETIEQGGASASMQAGQATATNMPPPEKAEPAPQQDDPNSIGALIGFGLSALSKYGFGDSPDEGYGGRIG